MTTANMSKIMKPYCAIHVFPLIYSRRMTFTGRARVTRADAINDLFLLPGRAFYVASKPGKLSRSVIQLSVDCTPIRLFNLFKLTGYVMHHQFNISSAHTLFMCFVFIWEQTATCATYNINWLVFITEMKSVYSAVRTGSLNKAVFASSFNG